MIKLQIVGNLGRDAVVREVNGKNVINFSVAHTERYRDGSGDQKENTTWVDCSYWTQRTGVAPYLRKGMKVYAEGLPRAETFVSKEGNAGAALRVRVSNVQLLGAGMRSDDSGSHSENEDMPELAVAEGEEDSDDLPF